MLLKVILLFTVALMFFRNEVSGVLTVKKFPHPLHEDMNIFINLDLYRPVKDYTIYLQEGGKNGKKFGDIPLHLSFGVGGRGKIHPIHMYLSSKEKGKWLSSEDHETPWFQLPDDFNISTKLDHYEIASDPNVAYTYDYRKPVEDLGKIEFLVLRGDFRIKKILLNDEIDMTSEEYDVTPY